MLTRIMPKAANAIAIVFLASSVTPAAATIAVRGSDVFLTGVIEPNAYAEFLAAVPDDGVERTVQLGSGGGYIQQAMDVGRVIRARNYSTRVVSQCTSACVLIWSAGIKRKLAEGARLGVHCGRQADSLACCPVCTGAMAQFLRDMRAPAGIVELQSSAGLEIVWATPELLQEEAVPLPRPRPWRTLIAQAAVGDGRPLPGYEEEEPYRPLPPHMPPQRMYAPPYAPYPPYYGPTYPPPPPWPYWCPIVGPLTAWHACF